MDTTTLIRRAASDLRAAYHCQLPEALHQNPDTALEALAEVHFGLSVAEEPDLEDTNIDGLLDLDSEIILLRPRLVPTRRRFVLAHEIGHAALRHPARQIADSPEQIRETDDAVSDAFPITGLDLPPALRRYSERDRWEREANQFAAELLAPARELRALAREDPEWSVAEFAQRFGVSAALIRSQLTAAFLAPDLADAAEGAASEERSPSPAGSFIGPQTELDPAQQRAAMVAAPALVVAGPGAGKTRVLVERFAYLVRECGVDPRRILALTFANRAAGEMRDRLAALLPPPAAAAVDVTTFHSLGLMLLQEYGHHLWGADRPFPRLVTPLDALLLLRSHLAELPLGGFEDLHSPLGHLAKVLDAVSRAKDEQCGPEAWAARAEEWQAKIDAGAAPEEERAAAAASVDAARLYGAYQTYLRADGYVDYADLIFEAVRLFDFPSVATDIQSRWDHILVDEFQDINYISGRLVRALDGGRRIVWAVGDPKQSIYGFRGASPVNLARFALPEYYPGAETVYLDTNYRSVADVVAAGQAVPMPDADGAGADPPPLRAHRGTTGKPAVEVWTAATGADEMRVLADDIAQRRDQGEALAEIAVLCRTCRQAQTAADALTARGLPHTWGGALEERAVFKDLIGALLLAAGDPAGIVRLAGLPEHALSDDDLRAVLKGDGDAREKLARAGADLPESVRRVIRRLGALADSLAPDAPPAQNLLLYLFDHASWFRRALFADSASARHARATVGQTLALAQSFAGRVVIAVSQNTTTAFLDFLRAAIDAGGLDAPADLPTGGDAVSVVTVHRAKGLEWPTVFVPNLAESRFPLNPRVPDVPLPPGVVQGGDRAAQEAREEACLFYVAVTRARDHLVLSRAELYPGGRKPAPSRFLQPIADTLRAENRLTERIIPASEIGLAVTAAPSPFAPWPLPKAVPYSLLETYRDCGRKFLYRYIYRLPEGDRGYLDFHTVVYALLDWQAKQARLGQPLSGVALRERLETLWEEIGPKTHWYGPLFRRCAEAIVARAASTPVGTGRSIRYPISIDVGGRVVTLAVDAMETAPDGVTLLRRCHLGRPGRATSPQDDRPALYSLWAQDAVPGPYQVQRSYPRYDRIEDAQPTALVCKNRRKKMGELIGGIECGDFPARADERKRPEVQRVCRVG